MYSEAASQDQGQDILESSMSAMKTIILLEDEQAISSVLRVSLERLGYHILQAATSNRASKVGEAHQPPIHVLIANMSVRISNCIRLARAVTSARPQMAVLFVSGLPLSDERGLMDADAVTFPRIEFLQVGFMPWLLEEHVRELIGNR